MSSKDLGLDWRRADEGLSTDSFGFQGVNGCNTESICRGRNNCSRMQHPLMV